MSAIGGEIRGSPPTCTGRLKPRVIAKDYAGPRVGRQAAAGGSLPGTGPRWPRATRRWSVSAAARFPASSSPRQRADRRRPSRRRDAERSATKIDGRKLSENECRVWELLAPAQGSRLEGGQAAAWPGGPPGAGNGSLPPQRPIGGRDKPRRGAADRWQISEHLV